MDQNRWTRASIVGVVLLVASTPLGAAQAASPAGVSPGSTTGERITTSCPVFSWSPVEEATSYQLAVYRIDGAGPGADEDPVLERKIPSAGLTWVPAAEDCLERGGSYAWSVRAVTADGPTEWAEPRFFEITPGPSAEELEQALAIVEALRTARRQPEGEGERAEGAGRPVEARPSAGRRPPSDTLPVAIEEAQMVVSAPPAAVTAGNASAAFTVTGEVRTIDGSGTPRLWGHGRENVVVYGALFTGVCERRSSGPVSVVLNRFGLSNVLVEWGSAADACPVGTWVCSLSEVTACDTARPDSSFKDYRSCDGSPVDRPANDHIGWTAGAGASSEDLGWLFYEGGSPGIGETCLSLPVWCCW